MKGGNRGRLAVGVLLVLLGVWFLAVQLLPGLDAWVERTFDWPLLIVGVGVGLLLLGVLTGAHGLAVPATIVGGIGGLLYWQNATGNWASWAYAWALIPGFVGAGIILAGLLSGNLRETLGSGGWLVMLSLVMFFVFGSFLGGAELFGAYWPVLLIVLGALLLIQPLLRRRSEP